VEQSNALLMIDLPNGERVTMFARVLDNIRNGRIIVLEAGNGWDGTSEANHPCPGYTLRVKHEAHFTMPGGSPGQDVPVVYHCICVIS